MWYKENDWKYGLQEHGISIMTMHQLTALLICEFLARHLISVLPGPPYSLTYPLQMFFYSPALEEGKFQMVEDIIMNSTDEPRVIDQTYL
jgi:hypothetical protein